MKFVVPQEMSLLQALGHLSAESSQNSLRGWIAGGRVLVDGRAACRANTVVRKGAEVSVGPKTHFLEQDIRVLFEDRHLVVLDKPEGLLSVATDFQERGTVHDVLKRRFHTQRVYPVHRLDRETSGVMVFAYGEQAREGLKKQFAEHSIDREYRALVEGEIAEDRGTWTSHLVEDACYNVRSSPHGQRAVTHFEVLQRMPGKGTYLKLQLETGRKNQIRVHCKEAGHPVLGDRKYGAQTDPLGRLCLHAYRLGFVHPLRRKQMVFLSPLPSSFESLLSYTETT